MSIPSVTLPLTVLPLASTVFHLQDDKFRDEFWAVTGGGTKPPSEASEFLKTSVLAISVLVVIAIVGEFSVGFFRPLEVS